jgi:hypothetical protein
MGNNKKLVELIVKAKEIYAGDYTDRTEDEYIAELLLDNGVTVQEWIPVTERLPEDDISVPKHKSMNLTFATVLVCGGVKGVTIANRLNVEPTGYPHLDKLATNGWEWSNGSEDVTHWMPLPEPPKGE